MDAARTDDTHGRAISSRLAMRPEFIDTLQIEYGPHTLLGRFFLLASKVLRDNGIRLVVSSLAELAELQASNVTTWPLFAPMLDPNLGPIDPDMSYGFVGLDRTGAVACAQGGRIYDSHSRSLRDMIDDQSFFYGPGRGPAPGQPSCSTTASLADTVRGRFVYSGALWAHPRHRGHKFAGLLPRISRAYALTRWNTERTVAVVSDKIAASPLMPQYAYTHVEREFRIRNVGPEDYVGVLMVLKANELLDDLAVFSAKLIAEVDAAVGDGSTQDQAIAGRLVKR